MITLPSFSTAEAKPICGASPVGTGACANAVVAGADSITRVKDAKSPYWEAFPIPPGGKDSQNDDWLLPGLINGGKVQANWTGDATYFDGLTQATLMDKGFKFDNGATLAGKALLATATDPQLGAGTTNNMTRNMDLDWKGIPNKTVAIIKAKDFGIENLTLESRS